MNVLNKKGCESRCGGDLLRLFFATGCAVFLTSFHASADDPLRYSPNNTIVLTCTEDDGSYINIQKIHTTIQPAEQFLCVNGRWQGMEADWEGTEEQLQTTYVSGWSIEVHYDDHAIERLGRWKHSEVTGNDYAVLVGKHVPAGLSIPVGYATREERGCMLSRKFDPDPSKKNYPEVDWHDQDWDFVRTKMREILAAQGLVPPWKNHPRRQLVGAIANWIRDARLSNAAVEDNLHPVDFLDDGGCYCGGAANTFVAMCSILKIPARYYGTSDHAFAEFQDDNGRWRFVENQPDTFMSMRVTSPNPFDPRTHFDQARQWALDQNFDAVLEAGVIDVIADPSRYNLADMPNLGWFYNWSCPATYRLDGSDSGADLLVRPQALHDWVFNLYTGYGSYDGEYVHRRGMFMAERLGSVYELAALYSPRRDDLPYVCKRRSGNDNVVFLTPWRNSYYNDWENPTKVQSGNGNAVRKQFYLSDLNGVKKVVAAIILGPDGRVDHNITSDGGNWYYKVNGKRFPLASHGGFKITTDYQGTGMSVHQFAIPLDALR